MYGLELNVWLELNVGLESNVLTGIKCSGWNFNVMAGIGNLELNALAGIK